MRLGTTIADTGRRDNGRVDGNAVLVNVRLCRQTGMVDSAAIESRCLSGHDALAAFHIGKSR